MTFGTFLFVRVWLPDGLQSGAVFRSGPEMVVFHAVDNALFAACGNFILCGSIDPVQGKQSFSFAEGSSSANEIPAKTETIISIDRTTA